MAENLAPGSADTADQQIGESWQSVADQMHDWHPDLQAHAERHLIEHGISPKQESAQQFNSGAQGQSEKDKAIDAHNEFNNIITGLVVLGRRLDLGNDVRGADSINTEFIDKHVGKLYSTIRDAATLPIPEDWEHVYGGNKLKLAGVFADLARSYKLALRKGFYTSYTSRRLTAYDPVSRRVPNSNDTRRIPVPILESEYELLKDAPEEERLSAIAEMLDHSRYRKDLDADKNLLEAQNEEQDVTIQLLETLPADYRRDLLCADAVSHFLHRRINRPDLAARSLELISVPELREALSVFLSDLDESSPEKIVAKVSESSMDELERVTEMTGLFYGRTEEIMEQAKLIEPQAAVVINMQTDKLINFLFETFRMLPAYEAGSSSIRFMHQWERIHDEVQLGLHAENDLIRERPIYGALVVGDKEKNVGPDPETYGSCVVEIKPEIARQRTTFTYGDSLNSRRLSASAYEAKPVDFETALAEKIIFDELHPNPSLKDDLREPYVEAQILGGVGLEDIASISFPYEDVVSFKQSEARFRVLRAFVEDFRQ